jgi:transcriptional/translational regulatory protein YebC/TACO1
METVDEAYEIYTDPDDFHTVKTAMEESGFTFATTEVTMIPETLSEVDKSDAEKMVKLVNMMEDMEDVQEVYHNLDGDEEIMDQL